MKYKFGVYIDLDGFDSIKDLNKAIKETGMEGQLSVSAPFIMVNATADHELSSDEIWQLEAILFSGLTDVLKDEGIKIKRVKRIKDDN